MYVHMVVTMISERRSHAFENFQGGVYVRFEKEKREGGWYNYMNLKNKIFFKLKNIYRMPLKPSLYLNLNGGLS